MIKQKIKKLPVLEKLVENLKKNNRTIVFTNGCFDILHLGHVEYLESAKRQGDVLIVAVNSDASVRKIKGPKRPVNSELERVGIIAALEAVDFVTIFKEKTPYNLIKKIRPHIIVKGADWQKGNIVGEDILKKYGGKIIRIKFKKGYSTSKTIKKIIAKTFHE